MFNCVIFLLSRGWKKLGAAFVLSCTCGGVSGTGLWGYHSAGIFLKFSLRSIPHLIRKYLINMGLSMFRNVRDRSTDIGHSSRDIESGCNFRKITSLLYKLGVAAIQRNYD